MVPIEKRSHFFQMSITISRVNMFERVNLQSPASLLSNDKFVVTLKAPPILVNDNGKIPVINDFVIGPSEQKGLIVDQKPLNVLPTSE